jgi:phosphate transport system permease protein
MNWRRVEEIVFRVLMIAASATVVIMLAMILVTVVFKGFPALNIQMLTQTPKGGFYLGKEGGILNAIVGSLCLGFGAVALAACLSIPVVLYLNVYQPKNSRIARLTRFSLDVLWGVPSIVYGAFGFSLMLFFGLGASLLCGIVTVAMLVLPVMCRAMDESMQMISTELYDASYALGATRLETAVKVVLRQSSAGIFTAMLIAFGRGIGDAASVIFTTGFTDYLPCSLTKPAATLPLAIFFQLGTSIPEVRARGYASALVLTAIILLVSIVSRRISRRFSRHAIH